MKRAIIGVSLLSRAAWSRCPSVRVLTVLLVISTVSLRAQDVVEQAEAYCKKHPDMGEYIASVTNGQSQAKVKALLAAHGFQMPWTCSGNWSQNVGYLPNWTWIAGCSAYRARKGSSTDGIMVFFSVYQRVRYVDADTGTGPIVDEKTDKLIVVRYRPPQFITPNEYADCLAGGKLPEGMSCKPVGAPIRHEFLGAWPSLPLP